MAYNVGNGDGAATAFVRVPSHYFPHHRREIKRARVSSEDLDSISSLPDEILQVILSLLPTKFAIRTSVLSKRWRHVWSETPSLSFFDDCTPDADSIDKTLARYTARKMMSFHLLCLCVNRSKYFTYINSWIEFAMSRNVENLSLKECLDDIPDFLYMNSSLKQLDVQLHYSGIDPKCSVSWTSLKILSLHSCNLFEESFAKILSGSPVLETLRLISCDELFVLDLSKSPRLKILEIETQFWLQGAKIVAPHIHSFKFRFADTRFPYTLVDVSSLIEADLDIHSDRPENLKSDSLQTIVIKMLQKLQNVEKLTFGENFLQVLSLANLPAFPFPKFKAKVLTIETTIYRYSISGIARVLQHSPELKKLIVHTMDRETIQHFNDWDPHQLWSWKARDFEHFYSRNVESKDVALFIELVLKSTKTTLEKMVVRLGRYCNARVFEEVLQMVPMLSNDNNVSIVLISTKSRIRQTKWSS